MSGDPAVARALRLLAERLEAFVDGDERALETLAESLDQAGLGAEELEIVALILRSAGVEVAEGADLDAPAAGAQRVLSAEERDALSPEAWGALLGLRTRGALSPGQFERVLERLGEAGTRPVGVSAALEIASRVALDHDPGPDTETSHGGLEGTH